MNKSIFTFLGTAMLTAAFISPCAVYGADNPANGNSSVECRTIQADTEWQGTGISVNPNEFVCLSANGLWSHGEQGIQAVTPFYGPRGFAKDDSNNVPEVIARIGALVAKIGDNGSFMVEDQLCFIPLASGELMLSMNDVPGTFDNNEGIMKVRIAKLPLSSVNGNILSSASFISTLRQDCFN